METIQQINLAIVGACGRGGTFKGMCEAIPALRLHAVCDINREEIENARVRLGADEAYTDYEEMLAKSAIDAVLIGTPMPLHIPQAIAALQHNLHVLSEVPAGVSIAECRALVRAAKMSRGIYVMAENYIYTRANILVRELARQGLLGSLYYAEGEYLHELKGLNEITKWRRVWQTGIDGVTYCTHSLGPILQWMADDRVVQVCAAGSGHHYTDPRGDTYQNQDSSVMLCKLASGGLAKIRVDMLSTRPHAMNCHQLQGTKGCFESSRAPGEPDRIWLEGKSQDANRWDNLQDYADYLPAWYRSQEEMATKAGHGGGDFYELLDFSETILGHKLPTVGLHEAMDLTIPGLISQQSVLEGGR
ncbi:MAG: Gfo/Idh/MocA family oxidoreductase, partial [Chloroflexi bacterium]|nr:Gfo/Idh/MocA family oxidoreductase [Chloroflexota bacterium]